MVGGAQQRAAAARVCEARAGADADAAARPEDGGWDGWDG